MLEEKEDTRDVLYTSTQHVKDLKKPEMSKQFKVRVSFESGWLGKVSRWGD